MDTTKEQFGKIATTPEEMAQNRVNLQKSLVDYQVDRPSNVGGASTLISRPTDPFGVITYDSLKSNPSLLKLPEQKTSTLSTGIIGSATAANEQMRKNLDVQANKAESAKNTASTDIKDTINQMIGIQSSRLTEEQNANIPKLNEDLTAITNEIDSVQRAYQNELKALDSSNMTDAGRSAASRDISRKYASQLADLSIVQSARNRNLSTAQANVDRKIELQLEPLKLKLDYQKSVYEDNKDSFTKADDRKYQALIKTTERDLNKEEERVKTLENTKLDLLQSASEQGASNEVLKSIQLAPTAEEAIIKAGEYSGNIVDKLIKQQTLKKLQADAQKAMTELGVSKTGPLAKAQAQGNISLISGIASDKYLNTAVGPNALARSSFSNMFTGGKSNFVAGVEQLRSQLTLDSLVNAKARGATFGALSEGELKTLQASGSKLATWAIKDKEGDVIGYRVNEEDFKRELDKINNFAKLDYLIKGGLPEEIGAKELPDGTIWVTNSDGTFTQLN